MIQSYILIISDHTFALIPLFPEIWYLKKKKEREKGVFFLNFPEHQM